MSFERLREIQLVVAIGLFIAVLLIIYFINTNNARKWGAVIIAVQDAMIKATQKNDTLKAKSTIARFSDNLDDKSLGDMKITANKMYVLNLDGDALIENGADTAAVVPTELTATASTSSILQIAFIPSQQVKYKPDGTNLIQNSTLIRPTNPTDKQMKVTSNGTTTEIANDALKTYPEAIRGFVNSGYLAFYGWDRKEDATSFRDKFFSTGTVVQTGTVFGIAVEMAVN